jgi:hypothetical protein
MSQQGPLEFGKLKVRADVEMFLEMRRNVSADPVIYTAWSYYPNASTSAPVWYVVKDTYDGSGFEEINLIRRELPVDGARFNYAYDSITTYFS